MFSLLNWRLWLLAGLLALLPILYMKGRLDGRKIERAATVALVANANDEARRLEQRRQDRANEAAVLAAKRERSLALDAARARDAVGGLRDSLDAAERASKESSAAADQYRASVRAVFEDCSRRYQELAAKADGHASDVRLLLDAWPE